MCFKLEMLKHDIIAKCETALSSRTSDVRASETTGGNLASDAVRERFQTDVVIVQGGAIRGDSYYQPGSTITAFDLNREFPFPNTITKYKLKGRDLKDALAEGVRHLPMRAGCFPHISGMSIKVDLHKEQICDRIVELKVNSQDVDLDKEYTIASTEFIRKGGDGYISLAKGTIIECPSNGTTLHSAVESYMKSHKILSPKLENRIVIL